MAEFHNALPPGFEFDGYRVERVLGAGAFGITYLVRKLNIDREVAAKEYLPADIAMRAKNGVSVHPARSTDAELYEYGLERFLDEARTLVRFSHPNIVPFHRLTEANGTAYLMMEYQQGETLGERLDKSGPLDEAAVRAIALPLLDGLAEVHQQGFLHRDIKPDNIFIRDDGRPILIDFGAAREALGRQSMKPTAILTPGYAPFEQYSSEVQQGPYTDIYAMAATMYRVAFGEKIPEATTRMMKDRLVPAAERGKGRFGAGFLAAMDHGLALQPDERPQSVEDWISEFLASGGTPHGQAGADDGGALYSPQSSAARPPAARPPAARPPAAGDAGATPYTPEDSGTATELVPQPGQPPVNRVDRPRGRRAVPVAIGAVTLVLFAAAAGGGYWLLSQDRAPEAGAGGTAVSEVSEPPPKKTVEKKPEELAPGKTFKDCDVCPEMVVLSAGEFMMGTTEAEWKQILKKFGVRSDVKNSEGPRHRVPIPRAFALGRTEITRGQYRDFIADSKYTTSSYCHYLNFEKRKNILSRTIGWSSVTFEQTDEHPVLCVSHKDATAFAGWLSRKTGKTYRLPDDSEWEYAARAGSSKSRYWGDDPDAACKYANLLDLTMKSIPNTKWHHNCNDNANFTVQVGLYQANKYGLHDMLGNVFEWTASCAQGYKDKISSESKNRDCSKRVIRGGAWNTGVPMARAAFRDWKVMDYASQRLGFRVLRELPKTGN